MHDEIKEVVYLEWKSECEISEFRRSGDPAECPPSHYKVQPEYQGKLLLITGPPGVGKSTAAHRLSQKAGWVFYEADNFEMFNLC